MHWKNNALLIFPNFFLLKTYHEHKKIDIKNSVQKINKNFTQIDPRHKK